ncbi:hypothetical protein PanWU01x14_286850 [Parasponia andersonii]|uniref:Uncharacterized protein n=1 Tax=Parasponia andersonii TaxID=3476 RepID=A0A2P5AZ16_PARAD|nr:hypothetical protein PanWU01x14_286850 [Parasponia andersonii]
MLCKLQKVDVVIMPRFTSSILILSFEAFLPICIIESKIQQNINMLIYD